MSTITIDGLPLQGTLTDGCYLPMDNSGVTQKITALTIKNYMATLPSLTVSGTLTGSGGIVGTLTTASQTNITELGTLVGVTTSGQLISTVVAGTAPMVINSTDLVANLYVARAAVADSVTNGVTSSSTFANVAGGDVIIGGTSTALTTALVTVNSTPGVWGGNVGSTYYVPQITLDSKGRITKAANVTLNLNLSTQAVTSLSGTTNQITASASTGAVTLSLPTTVSLTTLTASNVAGTTVYDNAKRVVSTVTPTAGTGISIGSLTTTGPSAAFTITNSGVTSAVAGTGITVSGSTGAVTITNSGVTGITGTAGITASASTGAVTLNPTSGYNGYGVRTVSSAAPTGGNDGDIWYQI